MMIQALISFFKTEWYFAIPMTMMIFIAFVLVAWRYMLNISAKTTADDLLPDLQETLKRNGIKGAIALCQEERGLIARLLFVAGLEAADQGVAAMRRSMANAMEWEILPRLHFLLAHILALAKIATMVGLLGTVISMIQTFSEMKPGAGGGAANIATDKIGLALFATAMGLLTAIPLVFFHVLFKDGITRFEHKMKASAQKLIVLVQNHKKSGSRAEK
jgi:biopolymer transport protein ExbB